MAKAASTPRRRKPAPARTGKAIIILSDGTSNTIKEKRTNVLRLYGCIRKSESQVVFYDPGVGTLGAYDDWFRFMQYAKEFMGLAFGMGLPDNVVLAYKFLAENYQEGDRLYFFGFSRGSYTVRALAALVYALGIIRPEQVNLRRYCYNALSGVHTRKDFDKLGVFQRMLPRRPVEIEFLGLFDTVSSMFEFRHFWFRLRRIAFTRNNSAVRSVAHALAIDERRVMFRDFLWQPGQKFTTLLPNEPEHDNPDLPEQNLNQVWFAGVHTDVGGGYVDAKSQVPKVALRWMLGEAAAAGLELDRKTVDAMLGEGPGTGGKTYTRPDPTAPLHESLRGLWWIAEILPQRRNMGSTDLKSFLDLVIPLGRRRKIDTEPMVRVHESVKTRMDATDYQPPNLPDTDRIEWVGDKPIH